MKASTLVILCLLATLPTFGQYSARRLTRRIAPQVRPSPAPVQPAPIQAAPAPAAVQPAYRAVAPVVTAPAAPVDPQKVAAQKSKTEKDLIAWQKKRAEDGSDNAQYELGMRYMTGNGVDHDVKLGKEWLEKAAKNGNVKAVKKLEELKTGTTTAPVFTAPRAVSSK